MINFKTGVFVLANNASMQSAPSNPVTALLESESLTARVAHLCVETSTKAIIAEIFGGMDERAILDDRGTRPITLWNELATEYFNLNFSEFMPVNELGVESLADIDPVVPPTIPLTGEQLRDAFTTLRTKYTKAHNDFHQSGGLEEDADHATGDAVFVERFIRGNRGLYYCHLLFERTPPVLFGRSLQTSQQSDLGLMGSPNASSNKATSGSAESSASGKKRHHTPSMSKEDLIDVFSQVPVDPHTYQYHQ